MSQVSFVEALMGPRLGRNARLSEIDALIDWPAFEAMAEALHSGVGRPPYPALAMLKALYLQAMDDLSDPGLEEALLDRLSFRRFCGLSLDTGTPDETTILRFRRAAATAGLLERCFAEANRQLEARGLMLKKGTLMDATLIPPPIAGPRSRPARAPSTPRSRTPRSRTPRSRRRVGRRRTARRISATRRISAWTRGRAWCGARS